MTLTDAEAAKRVCHHHVNERECPNLKCTYEGMDGERYRCGICLLSFFLDYEEMK